MSIDSCSSQISPEKSMCSGWWSNVFANTRASRGTISGKQEGRVVQNSSVAAAGEVGSINCQTHDYGLRKDPVWFQSQS